MYILRRLRYVFSSFTVISATRKIDIVNPKVLNGLLCLGLLSPFCIVFRSLANEASRPSSANVVDVSSQTSNEFWIRQREGDADTSTVKRNLKIWDGGELSVPSPDHWASLGFDGGDEIYSGLIVKTHNQGLYRFPCNFEGHFIIAWDGGSGDRSCTSGSDGGLRVVRDDYDILPGLDSAEKARRVLTSLRKQNSDNSSPLDFSNPDIAEQLSDDLIVRPSQQATVIRTSTRPSRERQWIVVPREYDPEKGEFETIEVTIERKEVTIEVLEGEISVSSEQKSEEVTVREGQVYTYPEDDFTTVDSAKEANTCEMLRFLNAAYWSLPGTPESLSTGIAEQLRKHREKLGVSGRPPQNLSALEQAIFNELNLVRVNPGAYAEKLANNKQYLYDNPLILPGTVTTRSNRVAAIDETINFLSEYRALPPLSISTGMSNANRDHVKAQGGSGQLYGHVVTDGAGTAVRLRQYGTVGCAEYDEDEYENVVYFDTSQRRGSLATHEIVVMEMLINYRPRQTGNSRNLFNPDFQVTGVACGVHGQAPREMCAITYADGYLEK